MRLYFFHVTWDFVAVIGFKTIKRLHPTVYAAMKPANSACKTPETGKGTRPEEAGTERLHDEAAASAGKTAPAHDRTAG